MSESPASNLPSVPAVSLPVPDIRVKGYRGLRDLSVSSFGRINLITGRNSAGKSALLESIYLLESNSGTDAESRFLDVFKARGDFSWVRFREGAPWESPKRATSLPVRQKVARLVYDLVSVTHGHPQQSALEISTGASNHHDFIAFPCWVSSREGEAGGTVMRPLFTPDGATGHGILIMSSGSARLLPLDVPGEGDMASPPSFEKYFEEGAMATLVTRIAEGRPSVSGRTPRVSRLIEAAGVDNARLSEWWSGIALTPAEETIRDGLKLIDERVERVAMIGRGGDGPLVPHVRLTGLEHPLPLGNLGDGLNRLFGLILALVTSKGGVVLIDEIETGIHYTVFPKMWSMIGELAERLGVQVFATTHNWDCITGFESALRGRGMEAGRLIKLFRSKSEVAEIRSASYAPADLAIALRSDLELR